ncbi:MAG: TonB-dependent receptor plug domain-containing protein [Acidobacteriota bacterium]
MVLLLLLALTALPGWADKMGAPYGGNGPASLKNLTLEQLGKIEVTTYSKLPTELWNTPAAVYVITSEQIRRSGVTNIADALRLAPGVEVGRMTSTTWAVGIRGLQNNFSKSVLVLIDGRNVYTPLFAGVYWDVQDMPLDLIDRIEVIRGPGGTVWGPNAANGVINIITRNSVDTRRVEADGLVGNQDRTLDDVEVGGGRSAFSYRFFGRGFARRHEYHTNGINDDNWHQERFGFRADGVRGQDSYFLEGQIYGGTSPHIVGVTPYEDRTTGGDLNFRWQRDVTTHSGFYLQGYVDRTLRTNAEINETRDTFDVEGVAHWQAGHRNLLTYGGGLRWSPYVTYPAGYLIPAGNTDHVHTAFVQDDWKLTKKLTVTGGLKLQHNNYSGFDLQPSARVLWLRRPQEAWWAGITRAVTTPSDIEEHFHLVGSSPALTIQVLGDPNFKSEAVIGYEAGYRRMLGPKLFLDAAGYWNRYRRLQSFTAPALTVVGGKPTVTIQYSNQISGSTGGVELGTEADLAPWWRLDTNYSYLNSNFSANGPTSNISSTGSVQTYDGSSPKHMVTVQSMINLPGKIDFDPLYRFVSALPAQKVPAYQTMDLHAERALGRHFTVEIVGQNLFQHVHYEWGTGDPSQPPIGIYRAAYVRLEFHSRTAATPN